MTQFESSPYSQGVILSLRRIWREADMRVAAAIASLRARSFGTEVPQYDAFNVGSCSYRLALSSGLVRVGVGRA